MKKFIYMVALTGIMSMAVASVSRAADSSQGTGTIYVKDQELYGPGHKLTGRPRAGQWTDRGFMNVWSDYQIEIPGTYYDYFDYMEYGIYEDDESGVLDFATISPQNEIMLVIYLERVTEFDSYTIQELAQELIKANNGEGVSAVQRQVQIGNYDYLRLDFQYKDVIALTYYLREVGDYTMAMVLNYAPENAAVWEEIVNTMKMAQR